MTPQSNPNSGRSHFIIVIGIMALINFTLYLLKLTFFSFIDPSNLSSIGGELVNKFIALVNLFISSYFGLQLFNKFVKNTMDQDHESLSLKKPDKSIVESIPIFRVFTLKQIGIQLFHGILLLCMVYIPLDFLGYTFPGILDYSANQFDAFSSSNQNYFLFPLIGMLGITILTNLITAIQEEFVFRDLLLVNGKKFTNTSLAFLYSSVIFGYAHFSYIFALDSGYSWLFPVWWGLNAFFIGLISAWYFLKYQWIFPLIFAHLGNNIISSLAIRFYVLDKSFWGFTFPYLYGGFLVIGLFGFILYFSRVKHVVFDSFCYIKNYFKEITPQEGIIDVMLSILLFIISILLIII